MKRLSIFISVVIMSLALAACGADAGQQKTEATTVETSAIEAVAAEGLAETNTPTPTPTTTSTPSPTPTNTPTPGPLTSSEVFNQVSPAVAYIETSLFFGSGFLIEDGYILTNAHVVWPFDEVRVVFADGSEFENVPVHNNDALVDLAVLGPIESEIEPLILANGEEQAVGGDIYMIGYPGEVDKFPKPTISSGLISNIREWESAELTYFQIDGQMTGGQSGGVLVSERAEVIGITNFHFNTSGYGLAASTSDLKPRVADLIAGKDLAGLAGRALPLQGGEKSYELADLSGDMDLKTFVLSVPVDTKVEISAESSTADLAFFISDAYGVHFPDVDDHYVGAESFSFSTEHEGPYFVNVYQFDTDIKYFDLQANTSLAEYNDFDDERGILPGQSITGSIDYPGDQDLFRLELDEGRRVNVYVDSIMVDPHLSVARSDVGWNSFVEDDDSGGGLFGTNAEMTILAGDGGTYNLLISDSYQQNAGGYTLHVREPYAGGPEVKVVDGGPQPLVTDYGPMWFYENPEVPFDFLFPAEWDSSPESLGDFSQFCDFGTFCAGNDGAVLVLAVEEIGFMGDLTLDEYVDLYVDIVNDTGFFLMRTSKPLTTESGLQGKVLELEGDGAVLDDYMLYRFMYVHEDLGFNLTYFVRKDDVEELYPLIDLSFRSIRLLD